MNRLEKDGVIRLVDNNDWGTPLVPVLKRNGAIRICGDYETTINRYPEEVKHPLPPGGRIVCDITRRKDIFQMSFQDFI